MAKRFFSLTIGFILVILTGIASFQSLESASVEELGEQILGAITQVQSDGELYFVSDVVDGDTIKVIIDGQEETVRLLGIDTPETKDPRKPVECFGAEASNELSRHILNQQVRLELDPTQPDTDRYNRLLRHVFLADDSWLNAHMVSEGFAFVYRDAPIQDLDYFISLEQDAREFNRGLWSACPIEWE